MYIAVHRYIELPEDYRDYCDYLTMMSGSLTGIKSVAGGKLPYLQGNFLVNTEVTKNIFYGNALPGDWKPRCVGVVHGNATTPPLATLATALLLP